jgi:hypothetical protein
MRAFWLCLGILSILSGLSAEEGHDFEVVDSDGIYYGEGAHPKAPAVTCADDVWAEIPEYKQIEEEGLEEDDPKYHLLMAKATERFQKAIEKVAKRDELDMIGEVGSIKATADKEIPDVTKDLIDVVTRS